MSDEPKLRALEQGKRDFQLCFNTPAGQSVLMYFADFCRAAESCVAIGAKGAPIDLHRTLVLEGRREVFLEIQKFLNLQPEHLFLLATGRPYRTGDATDE
jgi:hypothetical protein